MSCVVAINVNNLSLKLSICHYFMSQIICNKVRNISINCLNFEGYKSFVFWFVLLQMNITETSKPIIFVTGSTITILLSLLRQLATVSSTYNTL